MRVPKLTMNHDCGMVLGADGVLGMSCSGVASGGVIARGVALGVGFASFLLCEVVVEGLGSGGWG